MSARHVFISHSSTDIEVARQLRRDLEASGYECWLAPDDVLGTEPWADQVRAAIQASKATLVLISASANQSVHVSREVSLALERQRPIVPVRIEAVAPAGSLEYLLSLVEQVSAFPPPISDHRDQILRRLDGVIRPRRTRSDPARLGTVIGMFTIESLLSKGSTASVYRARQEKPHRLVALKVIHADRAADQSYRKRFLAEQKTLAALDHPAIIPIHAAGDDGGVLFITMRLIDGVDLQTYIASKGRLDLRETVSILGPIAKAIDYAHEMGVIHRNLKPTNVILDRNGRPYLGDFAFEDPLAFGESMSPARVDALRYAAPEQLTGLAEPSLLGRADIYAMASIAYLCLAGASPHLRDDSELLAEKLAGTVPSLVAGRPDLPPGVDAAIRQGLARNPVDRHPTAGAFVAALEAAVPVAEPMLAPSPAAMPVSTPPPNREWTVPGADNPWLAGAIERARAAAEAARASAEMARAPAPALPVERTPRLVDEDAQFTVYRPRTVSPGEWHTMLAFAHLAGRRPGDPPDQPDPVEEVRRQAATILGANAPDYSTATHDSSAGIPREGEITFIPSAPGIAFNPHERRFVWQESVHREEFRLRAGADLDGSTVRGSLAVFLGSILLADVGLTFRVDSAAKAVVTPEVHTARRYRSIFASYSHLDSDIVRQCAIYAKSLGDRLLQDVIDLRSGEEWNPRLLEMVRDADVFQLFWSTNSMRSKYVRQEWEYAIALRREHFVRPVFWEEPMPKDGNLGLPTDELKRFHFQQISLAAVNHAAAPRDQTGAIALSPTALDRGVPARRWMSARASLLPAALVLVMLLVLLFAFASVGLVGSPPR